MNIIESVSFYCFIFSFVDIHYQLVPYLLTTGSHAIETNTSSIKPLARHVDRVMINTCIMYLFSHILNLQKSL